MGLFTYDTTLESVVAPPPYGPSQLARGANGFKEGINPNHITSYSLQPYEDEFLEHPDIRATWAVNSLFLDRFAQVGGQSTMQAVSIASLVLAHNKRVYIHIEGDCRSSFHKRAFQPIQQVHMPMPHRHLCC